MSCYIRFVFLAYKQGFDYTVFPIDALSEGRLYRLPLPYLPNSTLWSFRVLLVSTLSWFSMSFHWINFWFFENVKSHKGLVEIPTREVLFDHFFRDRTSGVSHQYKNRENPYADCVLSCFWRALLERLHYCIFPQPIYIYHIVRTFWATTLVSTSSKSRKSRRCCIGALPSHNVTFVWIRFLLTCEYP